MKKIIYTALLIIVYLYISTGLAADKLPITNYHYYRVSNGLSAAVSATGGINLTNASFSNTSFYNPALLAFRDKSTISTTFRIYKDNSSILNQQGLPVNESFQWHKDSISSLGLESEEVAFNYFSMANINFEHQSENGFQNYLDYYLDCYRVSYASKSGSLAFGFNTSFLMGRAVYLRQQIIEDEKIVEAFIDDKAKGYSVDFGAVIKSDNVSYGLYIPNLISKIYWRDSKNNSLCRRLKAGIQVGSDDSFISSSISRKFRFRADNTYHIGLQQSIHVGAIRGGYYKIPIRIGAYSTESLWNYKELNYGIGTAFQQGYFTIDVSVNTVDSHWEDYHITLSISVGM